MKFKKIIITGAATRMGAAIAKKLSGPNVEIVIHYNRSKLNAEKLQKQLRKNKTKVWLVKGDLSKENDLKKIIKFAKSKLKFFDCLINNASLFENDNLKNLTSKSWDNHLNVNLKAPAFLTKAFAKNIKGKNNNIINIIDQRVFKLTPFFTSYTLSKTGLYTLTKTSAMSLAPNIRVNGIAPGPTIKNKRQTDKHFKKQYLATPLRQQVDVKEICNAVDFFIKNSSITGQVIAIDSGQSLNWQTPDIMNGKE
jgi:NAD(P)-dependent dehydrogenase (short-subunit alcohol dehydrogenase family)